MASASGLPIEVTYTAPVASGGTAPMTTTCTPPSGAFYPVGATAVTCNVFDAKQQTASCNFGVTVTAPPRISITRFVAFGDSITEGYPQPIRPQLVDPAPVGSYPAVLQSLLRGRYTAQTITVLDEGYGGELVSTGVARLPAVLNLQTPGALLLLEGANDLNQFGAAGIPNIVSGLTQMVRNGRGRSMTVFVGTLLPQRANGTPPRASFPQLVVPTNDAIRMMAADEGAILVDLYQAFGGVADSVLIGSDGLHPTAAGNTRIAETFYEAIRARLETPSMSALSRRR
jgi:lysophospholipase L1-like esterase